MVARKPGSSLDGDTASNVSQDEEQVKYFDKIEKVTFLVNVITFVKE